MKPSPEPLWLTCRKIMLERRISQQYFCRKFRRDPADVHRALNGKHRTRLLRRIARNLGVKVS